MSKRKCSAKGCEYPVFGKGFCKSHYPKTPIKKITERGLVKKQEKKERTEKLIQFYLDLWDKKADKNGNVTCFESDTLLSHTIYKNNICCYSHQISKKTRPDLAFNEENVLIVHPNIHTQWEADPRSCKKMYEYTQKLKVKYE